MENMVLDGKVFLELMRGAAANLKANIEIVNDLNVFPIPDGDTGENMSYTLTGGINAASGAQGRELSSVSDKMATGMVLSARGNSGVILSQFFAGVAAGFGGCESADVHTLGVAFESGVRRAYAAVINPTEGTMLTVAREAVAYANDRITENSTPESFLADCLAEMNASLQRTPELLDVLKQAGVVDSGGAGLVYIIDGMYRALRGEDILAEEEAVSGSGHVVDVDKFTEDSVLEFGYCTEFLLRLQRAKIDIETFDLEEFKTLIGELGDSLVVFQTGTIVKVHIHTKTPGPVFDFAQRYGEFLTMKVENMTLQHNERLVKNNITAPVQQTKKERSAFAVVTVAAGSGVQEALRGLGADLVIDGGQGNNPSSEDFIKAFDAVNADTVFVLPNNSNIIMAARQAGQLYEGADIRVIESKSIGDAYAILSMLDYSCGNADEIAEAMDEAKEGVETGLVTTAIRDTVLDGVQIHTGDHIGFCGKTMLAADPDVMLTVKQMLTKMADDDHEVLIAIYGDTVTEAQKAAFRQMMSGDFSGMELYELDGGQDVYDFQLILE